MFFGIHLRTMSLEELMNLIQNMCLDIILLNTFNIITPSPGAIALI